MVGEQKRAQLLRKPPQQSHSTKKSKEINLKTRAKIKSSIVQTKLQKKFPENFLISFPSPKNSKGGPFQLYIC